MFGHIIHCVGMALGWRIPETIRNWLRQRQEAAAAAAREAERLSEHIARANAGDPEVPN